MKSLCLFIVLIVLLQVLVSCYEKNNFLKKPDEPKEKLFKNQTTQLKPALNTTILPFTNESDILSEEKEPLIYQGNCFVKIQNWFYDLNGMSEKDGK